MNNLISDFKNNRINIAVITTSRADYGLLSPLLKKLQGDDFFDLQLIITGSHLSDKHGMTSQNIIEDGSEIYDSVDMMETDDSSRGICRSIAAGFEGFSEIYSKKQIDIIVVLGDRYELIPACICALIHKIPIAHIHGGELTIGAWDDSIRHSITKMSSIHFPSISEYGKRLIQMGEEPERVHVVGALGIDNILNMPLMTKNELEMYTGVDFSNSVALMTYHPVTLDNYNLSADQTKEVLNALIQTELFTIITMPNADSGSNSVYEVLQKYVESYPSKFKFIKNLGQKAYLSAMKNSKLMIGNSSSGIIESASFRLPVVNIGDRQEGRYKPANIIDCVCETDKVKSAINKALSVGFYKSISDLQNPYGDGKTAGRIINVLKQISYSDKEALLKKRFYDINF